MIVFPPCKINIGLNILSLREDRYHNLTTIFYPLPFHDVLEIISSHEVSFHSSGLAIPGKPEENLCLKAYKLLKQDFPDLPSITIYLHKNIPVGAGLGGGSADAAYTLRLLNSKYNLNLSPEQLQKYGLHLGSDCCFFLQDKPCFATGRGEELYPFTQEDLSNYHFVLACPDISISTAWAYSMVIPRTPPKSLIDQVRHPVETWKEHVINDFEKPVFKAYPSLSKIKENLYNQGALYAALSGSGSTLYGIFSSKLVPGQLKVDNTTIYYL